MKVTIVRYGKKVSFGHFCNEEAHVTVEVEPGEDVIAALNTARAAVDATLAQSEAERDAAFGLDEEPPF